MTLAANLIIGFVFFLCILLFAKSNFKIFFLYGLLVFQGLAIVPSLIYIEQGIFISEQGRESFFAFATLTYVLYFAFTFLMLFATYGTLNSFKSPSLRLKLLNRKLDHKLVALIAVGSLAILIFNAVQSKLPLFDTSVSRFTYWENSKYPFLNKIFGNVSIFIPFALGVLFLKKKPLSLFLIVVYFAYNFAIGQKFSPIVSGLFSFFLPIVLVSKNKLTKIKSPNKKLVLAGILLFGLVYGVVYKRYEEKKPYAIIEIYDPNEAMFYRVFGLQGHLMWGATEKFVTKNELEPSYDFSEMQFGMHKLMFLFAANKKGLQESLDQGFSFTNGYPSALFTVYPIGLALLVHMLLVIFILAPIGWILKELILSKSYFMAVLVYQFFNWTIYSFTMGYFYKLKLPILFMVLYAAYAFLVYALKRKSMGTAL